MVFNATSNNISVILWQSVLLVEESGGIRNHNTVIGTDCIGTCSCQSNYCTITTMTEEVLGMSEGNCLVVLRL
jgi:hypothetical protein